MKSQKGVTMLALVIYVASFMMITGLVGAITTYFYNNMKLIDTNISTSSEYNKLNLYMAKYTKNEKYKIIKYDEINGRYITFQGSSPKDNTTIETYTFVKPEGNNILYLNQTKLCSNVDEFKVTIDSSTGKDVLQVLFKVDGTTFSTEYVLK